MRMMDSLRLGFREGHLNLPSQVLSGFGFGQMEMFRAYLTHTYLTFPAISKPENNVLLLLTLSTMVSNRQIEVLSEWTRSADGLDLHKRLIEGFKGAQSVEQLTLTMAALVKYRQLLPNLTDHSDQPIKGSHLADLDALLHGDSLGNHGRVVEHAGFALIRVLHSFVDQFKDLIIFLETALDRKPPLSYIFDGSLDIYLCRRIKGQPHETVIAEISCIEMPKLRGDDDADWVNVTHPVELSLQGLHVEHYPQRPYSDYKLLVTEAEDSMKQGDNFLKVDIAHTIEESATSMMYSHIVAESRGDEGHLSPPPGLCADQYALIRLSKVVDKDTLESLDEKFGTVNEVPNMEELNDGSWEICVLKSHRGTVQDTLGKIFSDSNVELRYDPLEPTANDLVFWDYHTAKRLRRGWFFQRATRVMEKGWPAAAACYASLLQKMFERTPAVVFSAQEAIGSIFP